MQIVEPSWELLTDPNLIKEYPKLIEQAGRTCYQSHDNTKEGSAERFCRTIIKRGHESVLEHCSITVEITCDRSTSHQIVRHRVAAYSQESQRYVKYDDPDSFAVVRPLTIVGCSTKEGYFPGITWIAAMEHAEQAYKSLCKQGIPPEDARSVLPNATRTRIVTTYNVRQWRHVFDERCDSHAQWQIRGLMTDILKTFYKLAPCLFTDKMKKFELPERDDITCFFCKRPQLTTKYWDCTVSIQGSNKEEVWRCPDCAGDPSH